MGREILFRGQRITGEWILGSLIVFGERTFIYPTNGSQEDYHFYGYEVIPETVGQFTGLTDKNGKKIFEGDIVRSQGQNCKFIQVIEFHNTVKSCGRGWIGVNKIKTWFDAKINNNRTEKIESWSYFSLPCTTEVIGNIHDNPELLIRKPNES